MLSKTRLKLGQLGRHTASVPGFSPLKKFWEIIQMHSDWGELARLKRFFEIIDTKTALRRRAVGILEKLKCVV